MKLRLGNNSDLLSCRIQTSEAVTSPSLDMKVIILTWQYFWNKLLKPKFQTPLISNVTSKLLSVLEQTTETETSGTIISKNIRCCCCLLSMSRIKTFEDYTSNVFLPCIMNHLEGSKWLHVAWNTYLKESKSIHERGDGNGSEERLLVRTRCLETGKLLYVIQKINKSSSYSSLTKFLPLISNLRSMLSSHRVKELWQEEQTTASQATDYKEAKIRECCFTCRMSCKMAVLCPVCAMNTDVVVILITRHNITV